MRLYNIFPTMRDYPETKPMGFGIAYWFVYLIGLPAIFNPLTIVDLAMPGMMCFLYFLIDLIALVVIYREYLKDSWIDFRFHWKETLKNIAIGLGIFAVLSVILGLVGLPVITPSDDSLYCALPIGEMIPNYRKAIVLWQSPVFFGFIFVCMTPIITSLLYQATIFGPICGERPLVAYIVLSLVAALPFIMRGLGVVSFGEAMIEYLSVLPFYLCAAWVYQKSNTVWAPIIFQAVVNLIGLPLALIGILSAF